MRKYRRDCTLVSLSAEKKLRNFDFSESFLGDSIGIFGENCHIGDFSRFQRTAVLFVKCCSSAQEWLQALYIQLMGSGVVQGASEPAESLIPFSEKVLIGFSLFERAPSIFLRYSSGSCRQSMNAVCTDNEMLYFLHISMPSSVGKHA